MLEIVSFQIDIDLRTGLRKFKTKGEFFKRIFAPTEKMVPTGKVGA
jgi:hypothetical protein